MGRAKSRPRERQSRLSFGLRLAAGASSLPFLARVPRAVARPTLAAALAALTLALASPAAAQTEYWSGTMTVAALSQQEAIVGFAPEVSAGSLDDTTFDHGGASHTIDVISEQRAVGGDVPNILTFSLASAGLGDVSGSDLALCTGGKSFDFSVATFDSTYFGYIWTNPALGWSVGDMVDLSIKDTCVDPEFTAEFTDANGNAVERLGEGESFGVRVSITNGVTFTTDETVTVTFEDGHHDEDSTVIGADASNDLSATSLPSATLAAGTTSVQLGTATVVDNGRLETLEAFHAVVTLDGRSTEVSLLIEDTETGPIDLYFDEGNTIELNKPDTFDRRIDLSLRLQNGDTCYVGFQFTTYLEVDDPDGVLSAWYVSPGSSIALSVGEELAVNFAECTRTRAIAFEINQNSGTVGPKVVTFRAGRTTEAFGEPEPRITVVNAARLIVDTPPGPPRDLSASPGFEKVLLRWTAPASNGGDNVLNYEYEQNGSGTWTLADGDSTSHTVTGLTNGQAYTFRVRAVNYVGSGAASAASASVTPAVDTTPPVLRSAAVNGETVTLVFDEAVMGGDSNNLLLNHFAPRIAGRTGAPRINAIAYVGSTVTLTLGTAVTSADMFLIRYDPDGFAPTQLVDLPEEEKLQDANGNLVAAFSRNQAQGTLTNTSPEPPGGGGTDPDPEVDPPSAPRDLTATAGDRAVELSWRRPADDGGAPIVRYEYRQQDGDGPVGAWQIIRVDPPPTDHQVTGLMNGTSYTFHVRAVNNGGGASPPSESASATPIPEPVPALPLLGQLLLALGLTAAGARVMHRRLRVPPVA